MSSSQNIDILIRRIYTMYIDIKTKEFDPLKKDIMLEDLKNLYILIKDINQNTYTNLTRDHHKVIEQSQLIDIPLIEAENKHVHNLTEVKSEEIPIVLDFTEDIDQPITQLTSNPDDLSENVAQNQVDVKSEEIELSDNSTSKLSNNNMIYGSIDEAKTESEKKPVSHTNSKLSEFNYDFENNHDESELLNSAKPIVNNEPKISDKIHVSTTTNKTPQKEIFDYIDLNTRIGLVERFFKGNSIELSECLMYLNQTDNISKSLEILNKYAKKYNVAEQDEIFNIFVDVIKRRFN